MSGWGYPLASHDNVSFIEFKSKYTVVLVGSKNFGIELSAREFCIFVTD